MLTKNLRDVKKGEQFRVWDGGSWLTATGNARSTEGERGPTTVPTAPFKAGDETLTRYVALGHMQVTVKDHG